MKQRKKITGNDGQLKNRIHLFDVPDGYKADELTYSIAGEVIQGVKTVQEAQSKLSWIETFTHVVVHIQSAEKSDIFYKLNINSLANRLHIDKNQIKNQSPDQLDDNDQKSLNIRSIGMLACTLSPFLTVSSVGKKASLVLCFKPFRNICSKRLRTD